MHIPRKNNLIGNAYIFSTISNNRLVCWYNLAIEVESVFISFTDYLSVKAIPKNEGEKRLYQF